MQLTINVKDSVVDKVLYLLEHLKGDVQIIQKNSDDFDTISDKKLHELQKYSNDYKQGKKEDFEEYTL